MLRVPLLLDDKRIGEIRIARTRTGGDGVHTYEWMIQATGNINGLQLGGIVTHKESDGAFTLLHKVLGQFLRSPISVSMARTVRLDFEAMTPD